ncbi:PLP-dependent cysteine synthase family protein [Staphylococcus americanisciuri]|uniref:Cysteine synthase family protein n=1 Tax=Staphylococcus americanisciuri TaxID=2973940 RepID=A0ABT2EZV3_9STAP|nr:cysteine synthase family protein [Staphylococcus americanisciuri]MCS4485738.1 cysteine synthase family protein [Staphylococcus americanisciuri]
MNTINLIGNTPLVQLQHYSTDKVRIYAKLEMYNPGGSVKDRLGKYLIERAVERGLLRRGGQLVEATAGNTGIGLALVATQYNIQCVIFAPEGFSEEKIEIMRALGATIYRTPKAEGMLGARRAAQDYAVQTGAYYTNQFETDDNPAAYKETLAQELLRELPTMKYFVAGAGSGGTFSGVSEVIQAQGVKSVVVEPPGSILSGGSKRKHDTEGIGVEEWPPFLDKAWIERVEVVPDEVAFRHVRELAKHEGMLVGSSSGAALEGALRVAGRIEQGDIAVVFPDGSDRYMSKRIFQYGGF